MEQIQWSDSLSVGVKLIDDQHQTWIQRLNDISVAIASREGPREIAKTLGFLVDYNHFHFSTEERHMTENAYPRLDEHKRKHEELTGTLENLVQDFEEEGATHVLADFIHAFLGNWLTEHIRNVDLQFGAFLREKGISISDQPQRPAQEGT